MKLISFIYEHSFNCLRKIIRWRKTINQYYIQSTMTPTIRHMTFNYLLYIYMIKYPTFIKKILVYQSIIGWNQFVTDNLSSLSNINMEILNRK